MSCLRSISSTLLFGWISASVLLLDGGRSACVGYHLLCVAWYAWMDKDVDISYSAVQVNHNHEYRSSNQANFVDYPRYYRLHKNIRMFDVAYAATTCFFWFCVSCFAALDICSVSLLCLLCVGLPSPAYVRLCFFVAFLINASVALNSDAFCASWGACLRAVSFVMCFILDRFQCGPVETHVLTIIFLLLFAGEPTFSPVVLVPAVAPLVFARSVFRLRPCFLLLSTALFATITVMNQHG